MSVAWVIAPLESQTPLLELLEAPLGSQTEVGYFEAPLESQTPLVVLIEAPLESRTPVGGTYLSLFYPP